MKDPLGVSPNNGNQGTTRGKEKILLTSVGIEPTTSGLDLPLLCRLSYEVGQRKSGTIKVVNRGEEKVRVHMNVVARSTINTNGGTENRPRSIYQYSNMAPRLSGQTSIFGVVFFVSKSLLGIEGQRKLEKFAIQV